MQNGLYQVATPVSTTTPTPQGESMTFVGQMSRDRYIREQRAYGWEIFLSLLGTAKNGTELYSVTRSKI